MSQADAELADTVLKRGMPGHVFLRACDVLLAVCLREDGEGAFQNPDIALKGFEKHLPE